MPIFGSLPLQVAATRSILGTNRKKYISVRYDDDLEMYRNNHTHVCNTQLPEQVIDSKKDVPEPNWYAILKKSLSKKGMDLEKKDLDDLRIKMEGHAYCIRELVKSNSQTQLVPNKNSPSMLDAWAESYVNDALSDFYYCPLFAYDVGTLLAINEDVHEVLLNFCKQCIKNEIK